MRRVLACLALAVAVAGCGGGSDGELEAAQQRIAQLEAELEAISEQVTTLAPTTTTKAPVTTTRAPVTTTTAPKLSATCEVTDVSDITGRVLFEVSITNTLSDRATFAAGVDVYRSGEWIESTQVAVTEVPPGATKKKDGAVGDLDLAVKSDLPELSCEAFDVRTMG